MSKNLAIAIGINDYSFKSNLKFAKRDAEAMTAWFNKMDFDSVLRFTEDSHPLLTDLKKPIPTQPTHGFLRRFLVTELKKFRLDPEDNLWFFFAGHGLRYGSKDYLMPSDSNPDDVENTALSVEFITEQLRLCGADNIVLFLDACRNIGSRGDSERDTDNQGVIIFYSCAAHQKSWEIEYLQHGSFTYALLEGLRLDSQTNCATVKRLYKHLSSSVPKLTVEYNGEPQNPCLEAKPQYKMDYILLEKSAISDDIKSLKDHAVKAENDNDLALAKQLWIRVLGVSPADSEAPKAIERIETIVVKSKLPKTYPPFHPLITLIKRTITRRGFLLGGTGLLTAFGLNQIFKLIKPKIEEFSFETVTVDKLSRI